MLLRASSLRIVVVCLALRGSVAAASAQVQRGAIYGTVRDQTGAVLPRVTLLLVSDRSAPEEAVTNARGEFRFPDLDPGRYTLTATLSGFAVYIREDVIVAVGASVELTIDLIVTAVKAEVRVTAATPMLDTRRQGNVATFDRATLDGIPTARDPWALLPHLPGVLITRPNVGGSQSGVQAFFSARGDDGSNTMWNIDGVTITDQGASSTYFDFNTFQEVEFTTAGLDPRQQTGGLGINLVTKRGTNVVHASGRLFFTNDNLQARNISSELKAANLTGNRIAQIAEYGGDVGGPVRQDRLWFWASSARNDIRQIAITGFPDNSILNNAAAKLDWQVAPSNRASLFYHRGQKLVKGREAGVNRAPETTRNQSGATNIYKVEDSYVFGSDLFVSGKVAYVDEDFSLTPQGGLDAQSYFDFGAQTWHGSYEFDLVRLPQFQTHVDANWFRGAHTISFGFQYRRTSDSLRQGWPGDGTQTIVNVESLGLPPGVGFAELTRAGAPASVTRTVSFYVGDVISARAWTFNLALRFDHQDGRNRPASVEANRLAPSILPALAYPGAEPNFNLNDVSPRLGVTYRLSEKTIARGSYARFGSQIFSSDPQYDNPAQLATIEYLFFDANGDHLAQPSELLEPTGFVENVDPAHPAAPFAVNQVDPRLSYPVTNAWVTGIEYEAAPNFAVGVQLGYHRTTNAVWAPFIGLTRSDFVQYRTAGTAGDVTSDTPVYRLAPGKELPPGNAVVLTNRDGYHQSYWNVDVTASKRLADRWLLRAFFTVQQNREYFDRPDQSIQDPTPQPTSPSVDGGVVPNRLDDGIFAHARWSYSAMGLYELPWSVAIAGTMYGRQGYPVADLITVNRPGGLGRTPVLVNPDLAAARYQDLHMVDLRVQKRLAVERVRASLTVDLFNALNGAAVLRRNRQATSATFRSPSEIVAPRLVRLGLHLEF